MMPTLLIAALAQATSVPALSASDREAAYRTAGFVQNGGTWRGCDGMSELATSDDWVDGGPLQDLNGDGKAELILADHGTGCYGNTGQGYTILERHAQGWKRIDGGPGIPTFLGTRGKNGWRDIEVGGPGFCFPVLRWNGGEYALHRHQYDGKACKPGG